MDYTTIIQRIKENSDSYVSGHRIEVSIVKRDNEILLKISPMNWDGKSLVGFFTKTKYLCVHRTLCSKELARFCKELPLYYGEDCDLSSRYTKGIFADYGLFDISKIWEELGYSPTEKIYFSDIKKQLISE